MTLHKPVTLPSLQRAKGCLDLIVAGAAGKTQLADLREQGSTRAVFPRDPSGAVTAVVLNTAGGLTGGDDFTLTATAKQAASLRITTQAAERVYATPDARAAQVRTMITVADGALVQWLPQETILFDKSALDRRLTVELAPTAKFLMVEPLVFGRSASGEVIQRVSLRDRVSIFRGGVPLYLDGIAVQGDLSRISNRTAKADGAGAAASIVLVDPHAEQHLEHLRDALGPKGGASLLQPDVLVARVLATDSYALRQMLLLTLDQMTGGFTPKNWRL